MWAVNNNESLRSEEQVQGSRIPYSKYPYEVVMIAFKTYPANNNSPQIAVSGKDGEE